MVDLKSEKWLSPLISSSLWALVLIDIAAMTILQHQDFFQPYAFMAWPSIPIVIAIGYFIGPAMDTAFGKLLHRGRS
ncbi:hypothetical protein [Gluconobacter morbifer]|uniref:Uncharacterized protein n=1 Tax=Gluconobacter morbifer G707 TaxID=1088869 RepID=G6XG07_9PROT|nr:hypothetical protein [Gluconobacter morbifer]EHH69115.1 hypothetical protein GMO_04220 [Gluconobacter morbifer G707]